MSFRFWGNLPNLYLSYYQFLSVLTELTNSNSVDTEVSYDGLWLTRGFSLKHGCTIDILTGYVTDFEVISKYCQSCSTVRTELGEESPDFHFWYVISLNADKIILDL